ncbi:hypothetical protein [Bowmanella dokdonensis]|uniref:Uncharacterized protein n=1 Tax=Bowmanella dokdonensis TaxID=751969 RepID=A0A939DKB2_9ALTE|nr:hypothetical protein [Bowmanella dokdonensis]MBN7824212.1 hypothetical protein [Bowmanella dokdonensis]
MSIYLKAKHWQLFIVLVGTMFAAQGLMISSAMSGGPLSALALVIPTLLMGILFFGWLWAVSSACSKALPPELKSSPIPMQAGLVYALVYLVFGGFFFFGAGKQPPGYVIVMHLLAMAAIFYALGFTAKQLVKLEQGQDVSFFSYSGPFFLFWFFPIGIWFIQPKVNQLFGASNA